MEINLTQKEIDLLIEMWELDKERFANPAKSLGEYIVQSVVSLARNRMEIFVSEELGKLSLSELKSLRSKEK